MRIPTKTCVKCGERRPCEDFDNNATRVNIKVCLTCRNGGTVNWEQENLKRRANGLTDIPLTKTCAVCNQNKNRDFFTRHNCRGDGLSQFCKECTSIKYRKLYSENRDKENKRRYQSYLKTKYGITLEQKEQLFKAQGRVCAVCNSDNVGRSISGKDVKWPVDHDHKTGKVRGILCHNCNMALGNVKESIDTLKQLISYLEKHNNNIQDYQPGQNGFAGPMA